METVTERTGVPCGIESAPALYKLHVTVIGAEALGAHAKKSKPEMVIFCGAGYH